jgi:hypothetical protein
MPYFEDESLRDRLIREPQLSAEDILHIAGKVPRCARDEARDWDAESLRRGRYLPPVSTGDNVADHGTPLRL